VTDVEITLFEPERLDALAGADVTVDRIPMTAGSRPTRLMEGRTGLDGRFSFRVDADDRFLLRLGVSAHGGRKSIDLPAVPGRLSAAAVLCPASTDPLVDAVAEAQLAFAKAYARELERWDGSADATAFSARIARTGMPLEHPRLRARGDLYSWWIADLGIPPCDWPMILDRHDQVEEVLAHVPFPDADFARASRSMPLWRGLPAMDPRLYADTYSDYFPRASDRIEDDMAFQYLVDVPAILKCAGRPDGAHVPGWREFGAAAVLAKARLSGLAGTALVPADDESLAIRKLTGRPARRDIEAIISEGAGPARADARSLSLLVGALTEGLPKAMRAALVAGAEVGGSESAMEAALGGVREAAPFVRWAARRIGLAAPGVFV
jgi:hypothetical protein